MNRVIRYRAGYKYQLAEFYAHKLPEAFKGQAFEHRWFSLSCGVLSVRQGYAWDGPSGPTWDDRTGMRGSLVHDVLYQSMQLGFLPSDYQTSADRELQRVCVEDGMWRWRAWYWYVAVRRFGGRWTQPGSGRPVLVCGVDA